MKLTAVVALLVLSISPVVAKDPPPNPEMVVPPNAKLYVAPMDGFGTYIIAAFTKKKTPVMVVSDKEQSDFILDGVSESNKVGWARTIFMGQVGTDEQAGITLTNRKSGVVVFAYNVHKKGSARGKQSAGESIAKHLKKKIEDGR